MNMIRQQGFEPRRRRIKLTPLRIGLTLIFLLLVCGGTLWHLARTWAPERARYPVQGISVSAAAGDVAWPTAKAAGADFAYLGATFGAHASDPAFAAHLAGARDAGLRYGAIHRYDLCETATAQAARFIATIPRDPAMLPPVVVIEPSTHCKPSRDRLLAELNIFLNQIEAHAGKPAVLRVPRETEAQYEISSGINRTLWLEGDFLAPDYATRPWVMWTASTSRRVPGIDGPVEWDVVRR